MQQINKNSPWLGMGSQPVPTQQAITPQTPKFNAEYSSYLESPETKQLINQMEQNRQLALAQQTQGVEGFEDLLKGHLAKSQNQQIDFSPLMALTDSWTGSNLSSSYKRPTDSKAQLETTAALQQGLQKAKGAITDDEQQYLMDRLGLYQKADDSINKRLGQEESLEAQERIARYRTDNAAQTGGGLNLTPGQKTFDVESARVLAEWTDGAKGTLDKNLKNLYDAKRELENIDKDSNVSGRFVGRLPEVLRSENSLKIQQKVQGAAVAALRAALGSAFTEKENARITALSYDPTLSPEANREKVDAAIQELEGRKISLDAKRNELRSTGTLRDYVSPANSPVATPTSTLTREQKIEMLKARQAGGTP